MSNELQTIDDDPMGGFVDPNPKEREPEIKETVQQGSIPPHLKGLHLEIAQRTLLFTKQCESLGKKQGVDLKVEVKVSYG